MPPSTILYKVTIMLVYGVQQAGKRVLEDERVVKERRAWPDYPEKPEMMVEDLSYVVCFYVRVDTVDQHFG